MESALKKTRRALFAVLRLSSRENCGSPSPIGVSFVKELVQSLLWMDSGVMLFGLLLLTGVIRSIFLVVDVDCHCPSMHRGDLEIPALVWLSSSYLLSRSDNNWLLQSGSRCVYTMITMGPEAQWICRLAQSYRMSQPLGSIGSPPLSIMSSTESGQTQPLAGGAKDLGISNCINEQLVDVVLNVLNLGWTTQMDGSKGDECARWAMHPAAAHPCEGGDSEIGGDGDGVVMARSLSTSCLGGRDMEV
ncbi:hypothetical protein Tco_0521014 [Tanacetum coccineum]